MSLESAKKYGFTASMIQIIMPIAMLVALGGFYYQIFYELFRGQAVSTFWPGVLVGVSIVAGIVGIIGFILFLLSMYKLSNIYKEPKIFRNIIYGFLTSIIGSIVIGILIVAITFTTFSSTIITTSPADPDTIATAIMSIIGILAVVVGGIVILSIIMGVLYWKAFTKLGEKSGVDTFKTAGTLYLIGSILIITGGIGSILCWMSWIFAAEGYRKLQPITTDYTSTSTISSSTSSGKIYCSYCGIENDVCVDSNYCKYCGKILQTNS
jgi:uncharacterized membrane protein